MNIFKQSCSYFTNAVTIISALITITAIFGVYDDFKNVSRSEAAGYLLMLMLVLYALCFVVFLYKRRKIRIKIKGDMEIIVKNGNLFQQKGNIVVPVNCFFDTIVGHGMISENSWHGKLIYEIFKGDLESLERQIEKGLKCQKGSDVNRGYGKTVKYPYGTIIKVEREGRKFFLVALTDFDKDNHVKEQEARIHYCDVMRELVEYIGKNSEGVKTFIPPVGMGHARIFDSQENCIRTMIQIFRLMQINMSAPVEIVVEKGFWQMRQEM